MRGSGAGRGSTRSLRKSSAPMVRRLMLLAPAISLMLSGCVGPSTDAEVSTGHSTLDLPVVVAPPAIGVGFERTVPGPEETGPPQPVTVPGGPGCAGGWHTPAAGSSDYRKPLEVISRSMGLEEPLVVVTMRAFQGSESPPSEQGYLMVVKRWYVKGYEKGSRRIAARWLVEEREFGIGLVAVAPYGTTGFRSPEWVGFQYEAGGEYASPKKYPGLPGAWVGVPYDFVDGGAGIHSPGLPPTLLDCLADA